MIKKKIFLAAGAVNYINWIENSEVTKDLKEADLVLFEGGEDVSPHLYDEPKHPRTYNNVERDAYEKVIFLNAIKLGKPILGICRGSQLSCVMAGGKLVQHQDNPSFSHNMITEEGIIPVSSTHHQAQYPFNLSKEDYKILGWTEGMLKYHEDGYQNEMNPEKECEVVYYNKIKALAIQPHPEMLFDERSNSARNGFDDSVKYFRELLRKHLNNEL